MITKELAGRFLITDKLGQGGMGTVYKAVHTQMDRPCAIKLLSPASSDSEAAIARFKREAKMASRIDNPHAITIYDFGQAEAGMLYLAMEFIDGKPLSQVLAQERALDINRAAHITRQIAEALTAAHALGIVHRDLKPDNIMITRKGANQDYVKVLDFGIAKSLAEDNSDNLTKTGFILGTPVYMSPEQLSGEQLDGRSDVYSLAIIVYEMLSGRLPFEGDNAQAVMIKRLTTDPIPLRAVAPAISESVERVVMSALARKREDRTPTVEQLAAGLNSALYSGTQVMGARPTSNISDYDADRSTNPLSDRVTMNETREESSAPVAQPEQPHKPYPSPSAYVTQPSRDQQAGGSVKPTVEPTIALDAASQGRAQTAAPPPTRYAQERDYATAQSASLGHAPADASVKPKQASKSLLVIAAIAIIALVGLGIVGYLLFLRGDQGAAPGAQRPASDAPASASTGSVASAEAATQHYNLGKKHQEQAYRLINAGARAEADEESKKAIVEYKKAVELKPVYPQAHENLGVALYNIGNFASAVDEYRTAIEQYTSQEQKPTAKVLTNYGLALYDLKRYREAADAFGRALELDPSDADLHALQGFALHNSGSDEAAKASYRQYLSLAPSGEYADAIREILANRAQPPAETGNR
jgi:serine/threonine-protein kinase